MNKNITTLILPLLRCPDTDIPQTVKLGPGKRDQSQNEEK